MIGGCWLCRWFFVVGAVLRLRSRCSFRSRSALVARGGRSCVGAVRVGPLLVSFGVFGRRCAGIALCGVRAGAASCVLLPVLSVLAFRALVFVGWRVALSACGCVRSVRRSVVVRSCLGVSFSRLSLLSWSSPSFGGRARACATRVQPPSCWRAGCSSCFCSCLFDLR